MKHEFSPESLRSAMDFIVEYLERQTVEADIIPLQAMTHLINSLLAASMISIRILPNMTDETFLEMIRASSQLALVVHGDITAKPQKETSKP